jgi:phosphatidylglycerol---prolipoprotein diacylglyceryl transferase
MLPSFNIFDITFYPYAIIMGIAWSVAYFMIEGLSEKTNFKITYLGIFISTWIGSKTLFLLTAPNFITGNLAKNPSFWLGGGFVFYGGLIGSLIFLFIYKKFANKNWKDFENIIPALLVGHGIGRLGCYAAGCCFGVHVHGVGKLPIQLMEALFLLILGQYLYKRVKAKTGKVFYIYFTAYPIFRFINEFFRADEIRGHYFSLSTSQIISMIILFSTFFISKFLVTRKFNI